MRPLSAQHSFGRKDRLKSRKKIESLFKEGKRIHCFPLTVLYAIHPATEAPGLQAGVAVKKKLFSRAVDRNRIKRILRECWRTENSRLKAAIADGKFQMDLFILYTDASAPDQGLVRTNMISAISKLEERLAEQTK